MNKLIIAVLLALLVALGLLFAGPLTRTGTEEGAQYGYGYATNP